MTDLIPIKKINTLEVFQEGGLDPLLEQIEQEAMSVVHDVDTIAGRAEISSIAYKVAQSKTAIDAAGKELVTDWKSKAKVVDAARKHARDFLDDLKVRVRAPLTAYQEAEEQKKVDELAAMKIQADHIDALEMNDLFDREAEVKRKEAAMQAEEAKRQQKERDARIAADAAQAEKDKAEKALLAAERREIEIKRIAEQDKIYAVEQERKRAAREAQDKHDAAVREQALEDARKADLRHQKEVNVAAFKELTRQLQVFEREFYESTDRAADLEVSDWARRVVILIARGKIPGIRMVY